jgi:maleate isomerase
MHNRQLSVRLGLVLPSVNTVVEPWFNAVAPEGVTFHAARMLLDSALTADAVRRMDREEGMHAVEQLVSCKPAAIAYCCTASSIVEGVQYDDVLIHEIERVAAVPAVTATRAITLGLELFGARRLAIASPYSDDIDAAEHRYFNDAGFNIVGSAHLGITDSFCLADPSAEDILELARAAWHDSADALLITCLNLRSHDVIDTLEAELGKPVITSTQATLWHLLRSASVKARIDGYGQLLARG